MPIIQDRLKSILDAAQEHENALNLYQKTVSEVYSLFTAVSKETGLVEPALSPREQQATQIIGNLLLLQRISSDATAVLTREREHYRLTHHRNSRSAARQRRNRGNPRPEDNPFTYSMKMENRYGPHKHHASYTPTNPHAQPPGTDPGAEPLDFNPSDPHLDPVIPRPEPWPRPEPKAQRDMTETEFFVEPDELTPEDAIRGLFNPQGTDPKSEA